MNNKQLITIAENSDVPCEFFAIESNGIDINIYNQKVKNAGTSVRKAVACRVIEQEKLGFTTMAGRDEFQKLFEAAKETAPYGRKVHFSFVRGEGTEEEWSYVDPALEKLTRSELIDIGMEYSRVLGKKFPDYNNSITLAKAKDSVQIVTNSGVNRIYHDNGAGLSMVLERAMEGDLIQFFLTFNHLPTAEENEKAFARMEHYLALCENPVQVQGGSYPVLIHPFAFTYILEPLYTGLKGKAVFEKMSPLHEKMETPIFNEKITLFDDPEWQKGENRCPFDDEGVLVKKHPIIENGVLKSYMTNLEYAGRLNITPTGNGFRRSWLTNARELASLPASLPTNRVMEPGNDSLQNMIKGIDEGILLLFSADCWLGNLNNGDFSGTIDLGFKIEKGKTVGRIKNMRLSGNVYHLFNEQVLAVSEERDFSFAGYDYFPYVLCRDVHVS